MVDCHLIHQSIFDEWKEKLLPLENWMAKFVVVTSGATGTPASAAALGVQELFCKNKATGLTTPAKHKYLDFVDQALMSRGLRMRKRRMHFETSTRMKD
jgi:hypothetical protein